MPFRSCNRDFFSIMFDSLFLIRQICSGRNTVLTLDGNSYSLESADDFCSGEEGCSGRIRSVDFALRCKKDSSGAVFTLELTNTGKERVCIGDVQLFAHREKSAVTAKESRCVFAFNDSLESKNHVYRAVDQKGLHHSRPMCLIYDLAAKETFFSAQNTFEKNQICYRMQFDPSSGTLEELKALVKVPDHDLLPGKSVEFDSFLVACYREKPHPHPRSVLENWASSIRELYQIRMPQEIPAGFLCDWLISTKAEKTDSQIRRNMKAAQGALRSLGVKYIWISIDNLPDGMPGNWLQSNTDNFKDTVPAFLQEIRENGFLPGLWMAPFLITERSDSLEEMARCLIKDRKTGKASERFRWYWGTRDAGGRLPMAYSLDPDQNASFAYVKNVLETYGEWGVRYFMMDFLSSGIYTSADQSHSFCEEAYRKFLRKLRECCTKDTFLLSAVGSSLSLAGAFTSSRIGLDYGEARQLEKNFPSYPANYVINGSYGSSGAPNRNAVQNLAMWSFAHGNFFSCNSNVMTVDKAVPLKEAQIAATLFGISPSPVFFQDDFERMSPDRLSLLKKVLPRCSGMPQAVDLFTKTDVEEDFVRIFVKHIKKEWGSWSVCAVFNLNESCRTVRLSAGELGLEKESSYWMYEFWQETYCGTFCGEYFAQIPAMSCAVYRFARKEPHPWILTSDLHVLQGEAELQSVSWDPETKILSGTVVRAAGERGTLFLAAPENFMEKHYNKGMLAAKSALDGTLILQIPLFLEEDSLSWSVEFDFCDGPETGLSYRGEI